MPAPVFVSHDVYRRAGYGGNHPLAIARVGPVMDLCEALGWLDASSYRESPRATDEQLLWFHSADYLAAVKQASASGTVDAKVRARYGLGTMENPLFPGLFERAATSVGGSILAARLALEGRIAYHPAGGTHHGKRDRASGFCYFNDPVFAILAMGMLVEHLKLFVRGKMEVAGLGEFCCSSRPLRKDETEKPVHG